ncbi:MAG TPA: hotdog fold thioesterase [Polyangiaceae bacterium]|jgi:uncharacterized protein (TIGR00369 family)
MDHEALRQMAEDLIPFNRFLGIKVVDIADGVARLTLPFRAELVGDPMRPALHGGVISALADVAGGIAVWSDLPDPRARVSTIDLRIDYLLPGRLETLEARAVVMRKGNRVGVVDMRVYHPSRESETVATGKGVYNIVLRKQTE